MKTVHKQIGRAATAVAVVLGLTHAPAHAQTAAAGGADAKAPLKLVVGFPPGGALDIDGFEHANAWYGADVPVGTPPAVVQRLERAFNAAVSQPHVQAQLACAGLEPTGFDGAAAANVLRAERTFWHPIVEASGFKSEE